MAEANLNTVLENVGKEKGIDSEVLVEALEQAILTAARKTFGQERELEAQFNPESGSVDLFLIITVVAEEPVPGVQISFEDAVSLGLVPEEGLEDELHELLFQVWYRSEDADKAKEQEAKFGEVMQLQKAYKKFGRIAAQTAKQVIYQRVREAERDKVFERYKDRKGDIITGTVRRFERGNVIIELDGGAEAILPSREQVSRESYRSGDTIRAYVKDVDRNARGPIVILSRTHRGLLEKLFEKEVPEIDEKIVRVESSAREPGARAKIAVSSRERQVDPVGACVGMKGARVQAVVQELRGEKIDIVPYDDDPARFVCNAIQPAQVSRVIIDAEGHRMELIVPDDKLSLAIGKKGQNVRLASQLTGWRIDIHSESKIAELENRAKMQIASVGGIDDELASLLFRFGWRSVGELAKARADELSQVELIATEDRANEIIAAAQSYLDADAKRREAEKAEQVRRRGLSDEEKIMELPSVGDAQLKQLSEEGISTIDGLAALADDDLEFDNELTTLQVATMRFEARVWLGTLGDEEMPPTEESITAMLATIEAESGAEETQLAE